MNVCEAVDTSDCDPVYRCIIIYKTNLHRYNRKPLVDEVKRKEIGEAMSLFVTLSRIKKVHRLVRRKNQGATSGVCKYKN